MEASIEKTYSGMWEDILIFQWKIVTNTIFDFQCALHYFTFINPMAASSQSIDQ